MTTAQTADAFIVTDPGRLAVFSRNCDCGKILLHAELAAMNDLLSSDCTDQERETAGQSLDTTRRHQHHLFSNIDAYRNTWSAGITNAHTYLTELASQNAANLFWGISVTHKPAPDGEEYFLVNNQVLDLKEASVFLGRASYQQPERKMHLDGLIRVAKNRRGQNPFEPAGRQDHYNTR